MLSRLTCYSKTVTDTPQNSIIVLWVYRKSGVFKNLINEERKIVDLEFLCKFAKKKYFDFSFVQHLFLSQNIPIYMYFVHKVKYLTT